MSVFGGHSEDATSAMGQTRQLGKRIFDHDHGEKGDRTRDCFETKQINIKKKHIKATAAPSKK